MNRTQSAGSPECSSSPGHLPSRASTPSARRESSFPGWSPPFAGGVVCRVGVGCVCHASSDEHHHRDQQRYELLRCLCERSTPLWWEPPFHFPWTPKQRQNRPSPLSGVAGCATGSAHPSQAPIFMEAGFKASTYWVVVACPIPLDEYPKDATWLQ